MIVFFQVIIVTISGTTAASTTRTSDSQHQQQHNHHQDYHNFPDSIPIFNVRKDKYTGNEVSRGRLNELGDD